MPTILDKVRHHVKRTQRAAATAPSDDYRCGYMLGLRRHYRVGQNAGQDDDHAQARASRDSREFTDFDRGYRDGLAGIEPQS
jgi:hypothetical protein